MRRLARTLAAVTAAAATLVVASPGTALADDGETDSYGHASTAGTSCPGWIIKQGTLRSGSSHGIYQLYYSSARGGTNCLMVRNSSGGWHYMAAKLGDYNSGATDWGTYKSYAGPVTLWGTAGHCINVLAYYDQASYQVNNAFCR